MGHTQSLVALPVLILMVGLLAKSIGFICAWAITMILLTGFLIMIGDGTVGLWRGALVVSVWFAFALGVAVLDGLGIEGDGAHASHEHIIVDNIALRGALLAGLIASL